MKIVAVDIAGIVSALKPVGYRVPDKIELQFVLAPRVDNA